MASAPPTLRKDIPTAPGRLFDEALDFFMPDAGRILLAGFDHVGDAWTESQIAAELERSGSLDAFMDIDPATDEMRSMFREIWEGPLDASNKRTEQRKAAAVQTFVSASEAAVRTSPIGTSDVAAKIYYRLFEPRSELAWWSIDRWTDTAITWSTNHAAEKVTLIDQTTREGMRAIVTEAYQTAPSSKAAIKSALLTLVDDKGKIRFGLDAPRARVFSKFVAGLQGSKLPAKRLESIKNRRFNELLNARVNTISQTEAVTVANAGQIETYERAAADGVLDIVVYVLEWVARALRCKRCAAMDGSTREIVKGRFVSDGTGPKGVESASMPDLHPGGWCFTRTIRRKEALRQPGNSVNARWVDAYRLAA